MIDILELAVERFLGSDETLDVLDLIYSRCYDYFNARVIEMQRDIDVWRFELFELPHGPQTNPLARINIDYALNLVRTGKNEAKINEFMEKYPC